MLQKLNRKRAQFVMAKIDEILAWEHRKESQTAIPPYLLIDPLKAVCHRP
jgi:hypothetical protein